ncbi:DNA-3-methyladenine glycosylase [Jiangella ureilytica]|uniref:Putative 3-methyladenine DNA glycosylase n=1 Tax=Jiangella ureilytica TaxID=2530374 RepID=A0A4R4RBR2_9ACTN|nr:DNA-3-methyladenine glycosylase [Jiangella ureilytica]TDC45863.1 DNA-3-methyladenine glycosylase [Jiangella ureilytica]
METASIEREFLSRPGLEVAPGLLGCVLRHTTPDGTVAVRLTEVEAYQGADDPGSHAFRGRTPRNEVMFGPAGHLYVYFTYGMHFCANVVCDVEGTATAVLLRGGEVIEGSALAATRRLSARTPREYARGPARLVSALGLGRSDNGADLCAPGSPTVLLPGAPVDPERVRTGPRVGVSGPGGDGVGFPWRFWLDGEPTVSPYRPHVPKRRK